MPRGRLAGVALALVLLFTSAGLRAAAEPNYKDARSVQVSLGQQDLDQGLRLVDGQPDGLTQPTPDAGARQSLPNPLGTERFFYFDVHDSYINGGQNTVWVGITYRDLGLTPIYIEYDAFDPYRPNSRADDVTKKRVLVAKRSNSEGVKTQYVTLDDARFAGTQPGGADFRVVTSDELVLTSVSVWRMAHADPPRAITVLLNGKPVVFDPNDVQPFMQNNRTLVPMRALFNALGIANENIIWHNETRTVEAKKGNTTIALTIDDAIVRINGHVHPDKLDQPATIVAGRTVVPLRFVATQFGLKVDWDPATLTVLLTPLDPTQGSAKP